MSAERPAVVLALTPVAERAIEPLLFGAQAVVEPLASVGEADELDHELGPNTEAVLLSPDLSGLTPAHCVRARARGARLVGIALDEDDRQALSALAVDETVHAEAGADTLRRALHDAPTGPTPAPPAAATRSEPQTGSVIAVLGSKGDVLEMGRLSRSFSAATRRAAKLRQGGRCAYPRCRRRIVECHHVIHWARGGLSDLANAAWLCAFHHWLVHEGDWSMLHDPGGGFIFTAPDGRRRYSPRCPEAA